MEILIKAAGGVENVLPDPAVAAALTCFGTSSVNDTVFSWAKSSDGLAVTSGTRIAVYNALNDAGIEIPFDQVVMHQAPAAGVSRLAVRGDPLRAG